MAERESEQEDLEPLFAALPTDDVGSFDAVQDIPTMPLDQEPSSEVRDMEGRGSTEMRHA